MLSLLTDKVTDAECSKKCRSPKDATKIINVVTKASDEASLIYLATFGICNNPGRVIDPHGRLLIHLAASVGKKLVCEWLLRFKDAAINARDAESGYTPLHRSILHGHVDVAKFLLDSGANPFLHDNEYLTPFDLHVKDRNCFNNLSQHGDLCEVYLWGANNNFNLGLGHQEHRTQPEIVDQFRKDDIFCKEIKLQKFHSAFLTNDGRIFTCGHGQGGRLGLGTEDSLLKPTQLNFPSQDLIFTAIALGVDHSIFLSSKGTLWTCGTNLYHQLGLNPPPKFLLSPNVVGVGKTKLPPATGIAAARFHSICWNKDAIYTWGLNAGQLGHAKTEEKTIISPKPVASFLDKKIRNVWTSDGAIVVLTENSDLYGLQEFTVKRILSIKHLKVSKVVVTGGHLSSKVLSNTSLVEGGGDDLKIYILTENGKIYIWQDGRQLAHPEGCIFNGSRDLWINDFAVGRSGSIFVVTNEGLGFELAHTGRIKNSSKKAEKLDTFSNLLRLKNRLPFVYRAISISCDPRGNSFGVLQVTPKAEMTDIPEVMKSEMVKDFQTLMDETDQYDPLHDLEIRVKEKIFFCHKFIVSNLCEKISKQVQGCDGILNFGDQMEPEIFEEILKFAYTRTCDLLTPGSTAFSFKNINLPGSSSHSNILTGNILCENPDSISAYQFHEEKRRVKNKKSKDGSDKSESSSYLNPINKLTEAAKNFSITNLVHLLSDLKYTNGLIERVSNRKQDSSSHSQLKFSRKSLPEFYDVKILSEDGTEFMAHKCILAARSEYFRTMFLTGRWIESQQGYSLNLPVPARLLSVLLDFLYSDDINLKKGVNDDPEFFCSLIVTADQFLAPRLIQICERHLSSLITLKTVGDILQFSDSFHAIQLKNSCLQFIVHNLASILEGRGLDNVSWSCLKDVTNYYRKSYRNVEMRLITPIEAGPSSTDLDEYFAQIDLSFTDLFSIEAEQKLSSTPISSGKKKSSGRARKVSIGSIGSVTSDSEDEARKELKSVELCLEQFEIDEKRSDNMNENSKSKPDSEKKISSFFAGPNHDIIPIVRRPPSIDPKKFSKPSQKERKRLSSLSLTCSPETNDTPPLESQSTPPKWAGWSTNDQSISTVDQRSSSLSFIIEAERQKNVSPSETHTKKQPLNPKRTSWKQLDLSEEAKIPKQVSPPKNPWKKVNSDIVIHAGNETDSSSFKNILAEELEQSENLTRAQTKSLRMTQIEEEAIEDLKLFYNVDKVLDEIITVTRADSEKKLATPIWRKK